LAGTLDGCVQLLSVRGDEAARTHKSNEWYWLDAAISAEYCSTYRDASTADADHFRSKTFVENTELAHDPIATPHAESNPIPTSFNIQDARSGNSKATVRWSA
jgi:hypothetical protein